jgi:hypothetical protein
VRGTDQVSRTGLGSCAWTVRRTVMGAEQEQWGVGVLTMPSAS